MDAESIETQETQEIPQENTLIFSRPTQKHRSSYVFLSFLSFNGFCEDGPMDPESIETHETQEIT